jgi:hypothetical protein
VPRCVIWQASVHLPVYCVLPSPLWPRAMLAALQTCWCLYVWSIPKRITCKRQTVICACVAGCTVVGLLPAMLHQMRRPSNKVTIAACPLLAKILFRIILAYTLLGLNELAHQQSCSGLLQGLLLCMANCAMVFFMFSYQVRLQAGCSDLTRKQA